MKKLTLIIGFILSLSSCSTEEVSYSCDSEIDSWVKANKTELLDMNRTELSKLEISKQKAVYRLLPSETKKQFWKEKIINLKNEISFTVNEKNHLKYIENVIENHTFGKKFTKEEYKEIQNWMEVGKDKFGWTDEFFVKAFFVFSDYSRQVLFSDGGIGNCNCRYSVFCWVNNAGSCIGDCEASAGCGMLLELDCVAKCVKN